MLFEDFVSEFLYKQANSSIPIGADLTYFIASQSKLALVIMFFSILYPQMCPQGGNHVL
jgi:hypothetical protein